MEEIQAIDFGALVKNKAMQVIREKEHIKQHYKEYNKKKYLIKT